MREWSDGKVGVGGNKAVVVVVVLKEWGGILFIFSRASPDTLLA
jgi:hypothetical protein